MFRNLTYKDLAVIALLLGKILFRRIHEPSDDRSVIAGRNRCNFNTDKGCIFTDCGLTVTIPTVCESSLIAKTYRLPWQRAVLQDNSLPVKKGIILSEQSVVQPI